MSVESNTVIQAGADDRASPGRSGRVLGRGAAQGIYQLPPLTEVNGACVEIGVVICRPDGTTTTPVTVKLECTGGDVSPATDTAAPGSPAEFEVEQFADGDTCDVTEVNALPGWTADTSDCQDLDLAAGADARVHGREHRGRRRSSPGGCTFDRRPDRSGNQFPLICTPDMGLLQAELEQPGFVLPQRRLRGRRAGRTS